MPLYLLHAVPVWNPSNCSAEVSARPENPTGPSHVPHAGLVPTMRLPELVGLEDLVAHHVRARFLRAFDHGNVRQLAAVLAPIPSVD
jgi:hypothetical protein